MSKTVGKPSAYTPKRIAILIIGLFFMFVFGHICPTWGAVTRLGVKVFGVFLGWTFMIIFGFGLMIPSLLSLLALVLTGAATAGGVISNGFGSSTTMLVVFQMLLIYGFTSTDGDKVMVRYLISRKSLSGHPVRFTLVFLIAITVMSIFMDTGGFLLGFAFITAIGQVVGYDEKSEWHRYMLTSVFVLGMCARNILPTKAGSLLTISSFSGAFAEAGVEVDFTCFMLVNLLSALLFATALALLAKPIFKVDMNPLKNLNVQTLIKEGESIKLNKRQLISLILMVLGFMFPVILMLIPKETALYTTLAGIGQVIFMAFLVAALNIINVDGEPVCSATQAFKNGVHWDVYVAVAAVLQVSAAMTAEDSGISAWLGDTFGLVFNDLSFPVMLAVVVIGGGLLTQFFSNSATIVVAATVVSQFVLVYSNTVNITVFPALVAQACQMGFLTVAGSGFSAILHGYPSMKSQPGWIFKKGALMYLFYFIIAIPIGILFAYIM